jgi:glycosyltransferase involved in cell wall biosynthesis
VSDAPPTLSVVVPVYNASATLEALVERVSAALAGRDYELVLVNDGSSDASWHLVAEAARADPRVRGIDLARNYGQHNALLAGIRTARGSVVVTLDDDLQNPPEEIPKLLARLDEGCDVVYGSARERRQGLSRELATRLTKWSLRIAIGSAAASDVSAFRAFRTSLRDAFADFRGPYVSIDALLAWGTASFATVPVRHEPRAAGKSNYTVRQLVTYALNVLTGYTTRPLRFATLMGVVFTFVGVGVLVYVLVRYFVEGDPVPGFPFLASLIAIFSGAQFMTLGIIGEYLARVHVRVTEQPSYAVRSVLAPAGEEPGGRGAAPRG